MAIVLLSLWMVLFSVRPSSAARLHSDDPDDRLTTGGSYEQFPECFEVAKSTFPGGCDPNKHHYACYSLQDIVQWQCAGFDKFAVSKEDCAGSGFYAGACQFSVWPELNGESEKAATTPEQSSAVSKTPVQLTEAATTPEQPTKAATTPEKVPVVATKVEQLTEAATTPERSTEAATTPEKASAVTTTPEQLTEAATTPEQPKVVARTTEQSTEDEALHQGEELPECAKIAKSTYPGFCNTEASGFACYSTEKVFRPKGTDIEVEVPWACSNGWDVTGINKEACSLRPWMFEGNVKGKHEKFEAPAGIYAGACKFSTPPEPQEETTTMPEESTEAVTTSEQLTEAATTPEEAKDLTEAATTPKESPAAATTPMQPSFGPTTTKNGAAGNSAGSVLATVLGLAVYCLQ